MEDKEIIELYWTRDEQALLETEQKYGHSLFSISRNIVGIKEDAEECVNDTYQQTWENIPPTKPVYFFSYLAKIVRHISFDKLDYWKASKRSAEVTYLSEELENCIPADMGADVKMESREIAKLLNQFLSEQKLIYKQIFVYRYFYADSVSEIAGELNLSESKVKSVLFRMRKVLREHLEKGGIWL